MAFAAFGGPAQGFIMPQFGAQPFFGAMSQQGMPHNLAAQVGLGAMGGMAQAAQQLNFSNTVHVPALIPGPGGFVPQPNLPFPAPQGMIPILLGPGGLAALPPHLRPHPGSPNLVPIAAVQHLIGQGGQMGAGARQQSMTQQLHLQHQQQQLQNQQAQQQAGNLPPGVSDLDKLRRLQADIESGAHPIYKPTSVEEQAEMAKRQEEMQKQREEMERLLEERARENGFLTEGIALGPDGNGPDADQLVGDVAMHNGNAGVPHAPPPMAALPVRPDDDVEQKIRAATAPREPDGVDAMIGRATQRALDMVQRGERPQGVNMSMLDGRERSVSGPGRTTPPRRDSNGRERSPTSPTRPAPPAPPVRGRYSPNGPPPPPPPPGYGRTQDYPSANRNDDRWARRAESPPPRMVRRRSPSPSYADDRARKAPRFEPVDRYGPPPRGRDDFRGPPRPDDRDRRDRFGDDPRRPSGPGPLDNGHPAQRRLRHSRSPSPRRGASPPPGYGEARFSGRPPAADDFEDEEQRRYEEEKRRYEEEKARYYRELEEYERKKAARAAEKRARQNSDAGAGGGPGQSPATPATPQRPTAPVLGGFQPDPQKHGAAIASMWVPVRAENGNDRGQGNALTVSIDKANAYVSGSQQGPASPTSQRSRVSEGVRASYDRPGGNPPPPPPPRYAGR